MRRNPLMALAVVPLVLALSACNPGDPEPTPSPTGSLSPTPSPTATPAAEGKPAPAPLAADIVMAMYGTATADNGAILDVTMLIHKSTAWNDPAAADRPPIMTATCEGGLGVEVYEPQLWSFTKIDFAAEPRVDTPAWPADRRLFVVPSGQFVTIATEGFPVDDDTVSPATPNCLRDKYFDRAGTGTIVVGLPGDTDVATAAGNFTRWANHSYGIVASRTDGQTAASVGITLSECEWDVTDLGKSLNGDADWWDSRIDEAHCVFGNLAEEPEF